MHLLYITIHLEVLSRRYYNDLHVLDLDEYKVCMSICMIYFTCCLQIILDIIGKLCSTFSLYILSWSMRLLLNAAMFCFSVQWQEIKPKPGAFWPTARSAFQFATLLDEV